MGEHERRLSFFGDPRSNSPVSTISRFSYEEYRDSDKRESPHPRNEARASRESSVSGSSQLFPNHIGVARPLSAAMISSNDRFTSSATSDQTRGTGLDSTEHIVSTKKSVVTTEPYSQHRTGDDEGEGQTMWNPFSLWRTTLIGFLLIIFSLVIALIILYHISNLHHGLSTQKLSKRSSWTYGPTAGELVLNEAKAPHIK